MRAEVTDGKGRHSYKCNCVYKLHFSITVERIAMKFGLVVAPNGDCLSLVLQHCISFSFA